MPTPPTYLSESKDVLVAESNGRMLSIILDMLQYLGHCAEGASAAADVLPKLKGRRTDVLLICVRLLGGSGVEVAKRAVASFPDLKVIFLTDFRPQLTSDIGFPFVELQKPFYLTDLGDAVRCAFNPN